MSVNGIALIKQRLSSMSPVEKKIANCILTDPYRAVNSTIGRLAADAGTAVSSVVNFSTSLGFKGFSDLKINLAQNLATAPQPRASEAEAETASSAKGTMRSMIQRATNSFEDTFLALTDELDRAALIMAEAERIDIYAAGRSIPPAIDAHYQLMRLGIPADFRQDALYASLSAARLSSNGCALVISHTGRTNSVLNTAAIAKERGAKIVAITCFAESPLSELADVTLLAISGESRAYDETLASRHSKMLLIDSLCAAIEGKLHAGGTAPLTKEIERIETNSLR